MYARTGTCFQARSWAARLAEELPHVFLARHGKHVGPRELPRFRPCRLADASGGGLAVVVGAAELDLGVQERPEGTWLLVRHADTAGVDKPHSVHCAVVLHVSV